MMEKQQQNEWRGKRLKNDEYAEMMIEAKWYIEELCKGDCPTARNGAVGIMKYLRVIAKLLYEITEQQKVDLPPLKQVDDVCPKCGR